MCVYELNIATDKGLGLISFLGFFYKNRPWRLWEQQRVVMLTQSWNFFAFTTDMQQRIQILNICSNLLHTFAFFAASNLLLRLAWVGLGFLLCRRLPMSMGGSDSSPFSSFPPTSWDIRCFCKAATFQENKVDKLSYGITIQYLGLVFIFFTLFVVFLILKYIHKSYVLCL